MKISPVVTGLIHAGVRTHTRRKLIGGAFRSCANAPKKCSERNPLLVPPGEKNSSITCRQKGYGTSFTRNLSMPLIYKIVESYKSHS